MFLFTMAGGLETWVSTVLESLDNKSQTVIKMIDCVKPEIEVAAEKEEREKVFAVDDHDHGDENPEHEDEHHHEIDEHIWTHLLWHKNWWKIYAIICRKNA